MVMDGYHSQDRLSKLRDRITKHHLDYLILEEVPAKHEIRLKLLDAIREYLLISPPDQKFCLLETTSTIHLSARNSSFTGFKAGTGWDAIAKYASNLLSQPWRKEYRQIKTYSGYYKHSIESNLDGAEQMFEVMGYKMEQGGELVLDGPVCPDQVTCVSIDALIAYVECQILNEIFEDIYHAGVKATWLDIIEFRDSHICSPKEIARALIYRDNNKQYQQQHRTYGNNTHALQPLTDSDSGGYYNNVISGYRYGGGSSKRSAVNGGGNGVVLTQMTRVQEPSAQMYEQQYGNIGAHGHALPAAYSFPTLRQSAPAQYYPQLDMDYYRYSQCSANALVMQPISHQMFSNVYDSHAPIMYHNEILIKQQPSCCSNGYVPDMSVPSTTAIAPQPPNCLCNHQSVPTGQLIDLDNSSQQPQIGHDVPDGLATNSPTLLRMRNTNGQPYYQYRSSTYINGNNHNNTAATARHYNRDRDNVGVLVDAHVSDDVLLSGCSERGVGGGDKGLLQGDRDLRVEEGSGTFESWDYVYKNLESQGYSKDLGERGDILDRSGKRRISTSANTKAAELPEKLNGLTLNSNHKHHKLHQTYERRNSDETQTSYYDNVPTIHAQPKPAINGKSAQNTLMQQKMKTNKLSEVKAKVDSRRSVSGKGVDLKGDEVSAVLKSNGKESGWEIEGIKYTGLISNGTSKRQTHKQSSPILEDKNTPTTNLTINRNKSTITLCPATQTSENAPSTWECSSCTFLNSATRKDICEMCAKSRDVALLDTSMEIGGPQCLSCTLVNPKGAAVCQVCDNTLNNSPTYI